MALYNNIRKDSPIVAVEFSPVATGNFSFFHIKDKANKEDIKQWLTSPDIGQDIIAETLVNGKPTLITRGSKTQSDIVKALEARGDKLAAPKPEQKWNPWAWRGGISIVAQSLQVTSGWLQKGHDAPTMVFAISNLLANGTNMVFGAEKNKDVHHLRHLKEQLNKRLEAYLPQGSTLPAPDEKRAEIRKEPEKPKSLGMKVHDFMKRHSVSIGEIGLRYFGALALAFPVAQWKTAARKLGKGAFKEAFNAASHENKYNLGAGSAYLIGKTVALFSTVPDPYDPKPHTWIDTLREKYTFRLSSLIEGAAGATIAYDRFKNQTIKFKSTKWPQFLRNNENGWRFLRNFSKGKNGEWRDFLGGIGGLLFVSGFAIRLFAKFGIKQVDMEELNAHMTDSLAKIPREKLPQVLAETTAYIQEHFKDAPSNTYKFTGNGKMEFGQIFTQLSSDLYRYHGIALPDVPVNSPATLAAAPPADLKNAQEETKAKSFASDGLKKLPSPAAMSRQASHQERVANSAETAALGA